MEAIMAGAIGDLVLIIPAGVIIAICWLIAAWLKARSSTKEL